MAEIGGEAEKLAQVLVNIGGDVEAEKRRSYTPYGGGGGLPPAAPPAPTPRGEGQLCNTKMRPSLRTDCPRSRKRFSEICLNAQKGIFGNLSKRPKRVFRICARSRRGRPTHRLRAGRGADRLGVSDPGRGAGRRQRNARG